MTLVKQIVLRRIADGGGALRSISGEIRHDGGRSYANHTEADDFQVTVSLEGRERHELYRGASREAAELALFQWAERQYKTGWRNF